MLLGRPVVHRDEMEAAARDLLRLGAGAVLLKGGHLADPETTADVFVRQAPGAPIEVTWFESPRVDTPNTHGTGCTLGAAIAAFLARGRPLDHAVAEARSYLQGALAAGARYRLGSGHGPVHHFYRHWDTQESAGGQS
jgi:hydroxymethylpyrimidine/phosphomethylpyrimidine kinase